MRNQLLNRLELMLQIMLASDGILIDVCEHLLMLAGHLCMLERNLTLVFSLNNVRHRMV